jgi:hypothetical protein
MESWGPARRSWSQDVQETLEAKDIERALGGVPAEEAGERRSSSGPEAAQLLTTPSIALVTTL